MTEFLRRIFAVFLAVSLAASASGCVSQAKRPVECTQFLFDTIISVKLWPGGDADALLDEAMELCKYYDSIFDRNDPDSDVGRINRSGGQPCTVSEDTAQLIALALEYAELSGGAFDITCGRVTALWDFSAETPSLPGQQALSEALATVDWQAVTLEGNTVTVPDGVQLDLGGIAKGYIADRLVELLQQRGVKQAVINLGGNVSVVGDKSGQPYSVGIQSPFSGGTLGVLSVSDCSVVTAGSYQRCFELDGAHYHHILDLSDGMPARTGLSAVTIITESSVRADALATICFLLGAEQGLALVESMDDTEAVFVTEDGGIILSGGAEQLFSAS